MSDLLGVATDNLLSPIILFFVLGLVAGWLKSDLSIPEAISKGLALYLMMAIGFKGGAQVANGGSGLEILAALGMGILLSLGLPVVAYMILRSIVRLDGINAAAIAAHYGSVSLVTFVTAVAVLDALGVSYEGYLIATLAVMETPAIITGLLLARRSRYSGASGSNGMFSGPVMREVFASGSVMLLAGSFVIGWITGAEGVEALGPFVGEPFQGVLAVFLMDMGLLVAHHFESFKRAGGRLVAFGLGMPLVGAVAGLAAGWVLGLTPGGATLFAVLSASASYIVVPAAMRLALPEANPALFVTLALGVTFPFNVTIGIPLYHAAAQALVG